MFLNFDGEPRLLVRRALNDSRVPLSEMAWREGQTHLARARLDEVPVDLRHWEWFYLDRLYSGGLFQFPLRSMFARQVRLRNDGHDLVSNAGKVGTPWKRGTFVFSW